jgi:Xaa-Pro aminopeptidase
MNLRCTIVFLSFILAAAPASCPAADSILWKVPPPPPASWQRDRLADLSARRQAVKEQIGPKGILALFAAEPRNYAGDVDWPYRQENNFFYLTSINQPGSTLVLIPSGEKVREILFMPPSNPERENWTGHILTPAEAREISGIEEIWDARRFNTFLTTLVPQARNTVQEPSVTSPGIRGLPAPPPIPVDLHREFARTVQYIDANQAELYMLTPPRGWEDEYRREHEFAAQLAAAGATGAHGLSVLDASGIFFRLRAIKSPREIDLLRHAAAITAEAFERAYALAIPGTPEYEIQAQFEFTFLRRNAHWGYPSIVGAGRNSTTLHYETNRGRMYAGDVLLMDAAAEFDGYSADVTRTIPVGDRFTREQAAIYRLVWAAQQAGIANAQPGHRSGGLSPDSINGAAVKVLREGLLKLGLITDPGGEQYLIWFNHGISHSIGLNVHDPGAGELQPGMAVTVEPGLYFRPDALDRLEKTPANEKFIAAVRPVFEKYKNIGVRIEDDVLITNGGPEVISAGIPSKLEAVEAAIARLRQALPADPLP